MDVENRVQWVYSAKDKDELQKRYDEWAANYESDLETQFGWTGPKLTAEAACDFVPKECTILDAGAGTGLVGVALKQQGYENLIGADMSDGMLAESEKKGVYRELHKAVLGEPLGFESDSFDAVVSVGVFTEGHAPAKAFDELVRVTKPGGHVMFTLREDVYTDNGFKEKQKELEDKGLWEVVRKSEPVQLLPEGEPHLLYNIWVFRVL